MHDQVLMGVLNGRTDAAENPQPLRNREPVLVTIPIQWRSLDILHHQIGQAVFGNAAVEQSDDIGMIESGERLSFDPKAMQGFLCCQASFEHLDRDVILILAIGTGTQVEVSHPTGSNQLDQFVDADSPTDQGTRLLGFEEFGIRLNGRSIKIGRGLLAACQDGFHLGPQIFIVGAGLG